MTILVGYTPSPEARAALDEAVRIARGTGEELLVVNATPGGEHRHDSHVTDEQERDLRAILDASGVAASYRQYARGRSTVEEIKVVADEVRPSVVVIGLKRRSSFGRFVMGSVSDGLLKELDQPVLCVKHNPATPASRRRGAPSEDVTAAREPETLEDVTGAETRTPSGSALEGEDANALGSSQDRAAQGRPEA